MNDDIINGLAEISLWLWNNGHKDFSRTVDDACSELSKHRWIPVTERMPEEDDEVLVFDGVECSVMALVNKDKTDVWHWDGSYCMEWQNFAGTEHTDICDVTHWMPAPEPPKKGPKE